jgi:molybdenum cofactor synthesis domain-containing protein
LVVSDSRFSGDAEDLSGPAAKAALAAQGFTNIFCDIVPDEIDKIQAALLRLVREASLVLTLGGTGFGPRDVTPEATAPILERRADNLGELLRLRGSEHTPMSYLSRGIAGVAHGCLIVNLPGSPRAAQQGIEILGPLLPSILQNLRGDGCPH